jgi:hypothetical protein
MCIESDNIPKPSGIKPFVGVLALCFIMFNLGNMRKTKYPVAGYKELVGSA